MEKEDSYYPGFYFIGPPKSGTTWIYKSLQEHPEVFLPRRDNVRFFDQDRWRGIDFYKDFYKDKDTKDKSIVEISPTYFDRSGIADEIFELKPKAHIITVLRNPINRAYSDFWHCKAIGMIDYEFESILDRYMKNFLDIIGMGFYELHLKPYYKIFPAEQIHVLFFDNFKEDNSTFFKKICNILRVDSDFKTTYIGQKINQARPQTYWGKLIKNRLNRFSKIMPNKIGGFFKKCKKFWEEQMKYNKAGLKKETRSKLNRIYSRTKRELPELIGKEIPDWD